MKTILEIPKEQPMNYTAIDQYMEAHDFLPADKYKVKSFIDAENTTRKGGHKFVGGYLTRIKLCLVTGFGYEEQFSRIFLGIQANFK